MTKTDKLRQRLLSRPKDFTWAELLLLMRSFGFELKVTGGSGRKFKHPDTHASLFIHEPHPDKTLKSYQVRDAIDLLRGEGFL